MDHQEFIDASKIHVTAQYYKEIVEPLYMNQSESKEVFIEAWLKEQRPHIVKAHEFDISRATRELSVRGAVQADCDRLREENRQLQTTAELWETRYKAVNCSFGEAQHMVEVWKDDCFAARAEAEQLAPLKEHIDVLDREIIRLKARLFDLIDSESK